MREEEKISYFEQYSNRTHLYGKVGLSIGLLMMLAVPFLMGVVLKAMPDMKAFLTGFAQIAIVYIPSCVVEFMIYTPMLGAGGSYLAFITGNLLNMKILIKIILQVGCQIILMSFCLLILIKPALLKAYLRKKSLSF